MQKYKSKELFNRKKRKNDINSLHEIISTKDIFISDDGALVM